MHDYKFSALKALQISNLFALYRIKYGAAVNRVSDQANMSRCKGGGLSKDNAVLRDHPSALYIKRKPLIRID
ncbi:MAG: hypothetical protein VXX82_01275 [Verrucomicrobiota bacterium]|nr:hypothetical protein [Verrucomicrobiota bacterium]